MTEAAVAAWHRRSLLSRTVEAGWKVGFGAFCGMSVWLSLLAVGWAQRAAHREIVRSWWRQRPVRRRGETFSQFAQSCGRTAELAGWPTWFSGEAGPGITGKWSRLWQNLFGGLLANFRLGIQTAFNVAILTLPGGLLWTFGWYAGWMNSFHKGYENYLVGISVFTVGIFLFIGALFYLPMALARQAGTGNWRSFYDFPLIWTLIQRGWTGQVFLAILALVLAFPMSLFRSLPQFFPQMNPHLLDLTAEDQLQRLRAYFLVTAFYGFPAFVLFRLATARIYAGALVDAVQRGVVVQEQLADLEWEALHRLGLIHLQPQPRHHWLLRAASSLGKRASRTVAAITCILVWFLFVFNMMTAEFLAYHSGGRGWWNQPLIQLPWFDYTPRHLREAAALEARGERDYESR